MEWNSPVLSHYLIKIKYFTKCIFNISCEDLGGGSIMNVPNEKGL